MKIKMKTKLLISNYNKFRWKHNNHKIKANQKMNKIYLNLNYHGKLLELQFKYS